MTLKDIFLYKFPSQSGKRSDRGDRGDILPSKVLSYVACSDFRARLIYTTTTTTNRMQVDNMCLRQE